MEKTHAAFIYLRRIKNISYGVFNGPQNNLAPSFTL